MMVGAETIQSALRPAGPEAARLTDLWWIFFWTCASFYAALMAFFVAAWIRGRQNVEPDVTPATERSHTTAVTAALIVSAIGLLALLVTSVAAGRAVGKFATNSNQLEIEVTGHQWWWEVKYPNPAAPNQQVVTANEMHIPINTHVLLRVDTRDVIHSLWIPNLHGKRDLIPGRVNKIRIEADTPGVYRGQCAEFCGLQHAHMALVVVAETPEEFARWKSNSGLGAPTPATPAQLRGQRVFLQAPCAKCHNVLGLDAYGTIGPDLTHFRSRPTLGAGTLLNTRGNLAGWISNAPAIKPGTTMPPNQLEPAEMNDLLAYLETLK